MDNIRISFRNLDPSPGAEALVRQRVSELFHLDDRITLCRVVMEAGRRGYEPGRQYHVALDLVVPGSEIVARGADDELPTAIRGAFEQARRQLNELKHRHAGR